MSGPCLRHLSSVISLVQIFARPEATAAGHAQYAASITGKILDFYGDRFGIDYSQRKLGNTFLEVKGMCRWTEVTVLSSLPLCFPVGIFWKFGRLARCS